MESNVTSEIIRLINQRLKKSEDGILRQTIKADLLIGNKITTRNFSPNNINTSEDNYQILYKQFHSFKQGENSVMELGFVKDVTNTFYEPGISLGQGDGLGGNRGYITKDTNSLNLFYTGSLALGEVAGIAIYKDKIETSVPSITFNKNLANEFLIDAANWTAKVTKTQLEDAANNYEIPKANLKATDVAYWDAGGSQSGLALSYYNLMNTDLGKTAALPTSISMGTHGIKATATGGTSYAQLDYRGLYINNGAIQIQNSSGSTILNGSGMYAEHIIGNYITTYSWDNNGLPANYQIMYKQYHQFCEAGSGNVKLALGYVNDPSNIPVPGIVLGYGSGYGAVGKGFITKDTTALNLYYVSDTNAANGISISGTGIRCTVPLTLDSTLSQSYVTQSGWMSNLTSKLNSSGNFGVGLSGKRIELTDSLQGKNSSGQPMGLYCDPTYSDLYLYYNGSEMFKIYNNVDGTASMFFWGHSIGYGSSTAFYPSGSWNFSNATVSGLSVTAVYS